VAKEPWRSVALARPSLSFAEASESPCATCGSAPCCRHLPLRVLEGRTLLELDFARYALGFARIELGLAESGAWTIYYRAACRFLEADTYRCTVHDGPAQPAVCRNFNPHGCGYRRTLREPSTEYLRIDGARMAWILDRTRFDDDRAVIERPTWQAMRVAFGAMPYRAPRDDVGPVEDAHASASTFDAAAPCTGCAAWCCTALSFPVPVPTHHSHVDYLRFALGFPGVELGIADDEWSLVVRTRCEHLVDHRCGVYGRPERPLTCRYYDEHRCLARIRLGEARPPGFVRVRYDQFASVERGFTFDGSGRAQRCPTVEEVRAAIEGEVRGAIGDPVVHHRLDGP
jgi:hypothetical protein